MRALNLMMVCSLVAGATLAAPAQAQDVRRCVTVEGATLFTDRRCEDVGAIDRLPRTAPPHDPRLYRRGCAHTLADLVQEMTLAIDARDVNRLAGVYLWTGISNANARSILERLEDVASRPLLDIAPIRPPPAPIVDAQGRPMDGSADGDYSRTAPRTRPTGLQVEQTLTDGSTPSRTRFGLRHSHGCVWIGD